LRANDVEEMKRNRMRDAEAEAGLDPRGTADPYAPYSAPGSEGPSSPGGVYADGFNQSNQALPLVSNASPFVRAGMYNDEFEERKSLHSEEYDGRSQFTSHRDESTSNFGTESYAPSRNMFQNADKKPLADKEALPGEIMDGEVAEEIRDSSARRKWLILVWMLTWWCPSFCIAWVGRMKRLDVRQAWREKLAINIIIWFICGCMIFVIAVLGVVICPTEHVFSSSELQSHSLQNSPNNALTAIRGEVFNLNGIAATHLTTISIIPIKSIMKYAGVTADTIFPVQVSYFRCLYAIRSNVSLGQCSLQWGQRKRQSVCRTGFIQYHGSERPIP
jgi:chitin synthase